MSKFKYVLSIVVLSMVLSVTGCGASNGNQHADSSVAAEESSPAETTQKADNSQTDAPADQEEEKEPSHDLTGADAEGYMMLLMRREQMRRPAAWSSLTGDTD